jgi:hypothetical protein
MSLNDSVALYNFYRRYLWSSDDFTAFQQGMVDNVRNSLGSLMGPAVLSGGAITPGSGLSVNVAGFVAVGDDGYVHVKNSTTSNLALAAAHATLARKDLIVARKSLVNGTMISRPTTPFDSVALTTLQKTQVVVITGTPGASPAYPSKLAGDVVLGGVTVPATATVPGTIDTSIKEIVQENPNFTNTFYGALNMQYFGDGSDGDVSIASGETVLTRDMYYRNLTISGTGKLTPAGYKVFVSETLDLTNAPLGAIAGYSGTVVAWTTASAINASGATPGAAGAAQPTGTVGGSGAGGAGGAIATDGGSPASPGLACGGVGGTGGSAGAHSGGTSQSTTNFVIRRPTTEMLRGATLIYGGTGGGGGAGANNVATSGAGGGGGGGAGVVFIAARTIARSSSTTAGGAIDVRGQTGGAGGVGTSSGNENGGGGGSGGGGGFLYIMYQFLVGTAKTGLITLDGGNGGNGGNGHGAGTGGDGGSGAASGVACIIDLGTPAVAVSAAVAASAGSNHSGNLGGAGGARGQLSLTL